MAYKIKGINQPGEWDVRFWYGRGAYWTLGWKGRYSVVFRVLHFPYLRFTSRFKGRYGRYDLFPSAGITWHIHFGRTASRQIPFTPPVP